MAKKHGNRKSTRQFVISALMVAITNSCVEDDSKPKKLSNEEFIYESINCDLLTDSYVTDGEIAFDERKFNAAVAIADRAIALNDRCGAAYALGAAATQQILWSLPRRAPHELRKELSLKCLRYSNRALQLHTEIDRMATLQKACVPRARAVASRGLAGKPIGYRAAGLAYDHRVPFRKSDDGPPPNSSRDQTITPEPGLALPPQAQERPGVAQQEQGVP